MSTHEQDIREANIYAEYWKCRKAREVGMKFGVTEAQVHRIWKKMRALDPKLPKGLCKCGNPRSGAQYYCAECLRFHAKQRRERMTPEQRKKENARSYTHVLIKRGKIRKQPCGECGRYPSEAHHPDYNDAYRILWLCRDCHMAEHKKLNLVKLCQTKLSTQTSKPID